ncbi:Acetyltransferase involved in cellulose biosynthesis, CelD/BcsL family [Bradyrhizobium lablabi]|uniref:Acetyltransferase involved in cellulose biosynthesis, CelD/BcsL family n=1 Tax=Bradyrhizobium lablabi TaxID=722472 RepID=A0A1M7EL78_9BRAD|nr:GNAT family N-acetyltransferase [Bradyrhizobium lablabi]SHL92424.1 Acetyltransferase involved in cellulose biosynthesis, CelD/BcsL family [Bradyrhizobium lablabi]
MTMAVAIESRTAEATAWSRASRIAGIDIFHDLSRAETIWRGLERQQHVSTPYQRFDFLGPWQRQVGEREGVLPFIVIAYDAERRPLLLLPLALRRQYGVRTTCFMGGKHATFNMALWDRDFAAEATAVDLDALIAAIREQSGVDVLALGQQPRRWRDVPNPMALLPNQPSANDCPLLIIVPDAPPTARISHSFRRRLKAKERKLHKLPGYRYGAAATDAEIKRLLDWFFQMKPLRMAEQKLPNVFADPGVEEFVRTACMAKLAGGGHIIDIHALECDDEVIAIFAGVADGHRFSMMFNTYTMSANSRFSPGLILMRDIVDHYARRGYRAIDFGVGSDDYKRFFCKSDEPIFDCFIPLSPRGRLAAAAMSGVNRAKYLVKHNQALLGLAQKLRSAFH